jgi:hypothetical protein
MTTLIPGPLRYASLEGRVLCAKIEQIPVTELGSLFLNQNISPPESLLTNSLDVRKAS